MVDEPLNNLPDDEIIAFKRLVAHEYIEVKLMERGLGYRSFNQYNETNPFGFGAHDIAPLIYDSKYLDFKRQINPPPIDINHFGNLDEIINWYINFYKL